MRPLATTRLGSAGLTVLELVIASFILLTVFLGVWFTYSTNQKVWSRGRDKILLQQALTQAAEAIGRDVRAGGSVSLNGASDLRIYDRNNVELRRYFIDADRLSTATGTPVVPEKCISVNFAIDADTTQVRFTLTLQDAWENNATIRSAAHLRNIAGIIEFSLTAPVRPTAPGLEVST